MSLEISIELFFFPFLYSSVGFYDISVVSSRCNCYIIAEGFFFLLSFFVGYIISFGLVRLRTIRLSARAGAHIECRCSRSRAEDVTITNVIIKTPDRK